MTPMHICHLSQVRSFTFLCSALLKHALGSCLLCSKSKPNLRYYSASLGSAAVVQGGLAVDFEQHNG